ncbi:TetR/AcrR family transcriptional regulator [Sphingobium sp. CAP-1]|uniref:TetR/AcrR family transcriptional regulator n=1 Tax=Sphingobium sp. CAP-1 TaxID=2676077 RepID=UPI0018AD2545|nr:TetR/AcrR family transcriptional regulator [Sphingobium sp. CAP-1]
MERAILSTALDMFLAEGFDAVSMERVAIAVGISRTTLYSKYSTKALLFRAVVHDAIAQWYKDSSGNVGHSLRDIRDILRHHVGVIARLLVDPVFDAFQQLVIAHQNRFPEFAAIMHESGYLDAIRLLSRDIRAASERDRLPLRDPDTVAEQLITSIYGWYLQYRLVRSLTAEDIENFGCRVVDLLLSARQDW